MKFTYIRLPYKQFTLFPLGDWHWGSPQTNVALIATTIREIAARPDARWIGMGDLIENAIVGSLGDVYTQTSSPQEQIDAVTNLLEPIKDKGLFLIQGNHENRSFKTVGLIPEMYLSYKLDIPYMGYSCMATIDLEKSKTPRGFTIYCHHSTGGGYTTGAKVNAGEKLRAIVPTADAIFIAHHHMTDRHPVKWYEPGRGQVIPKVGYDYWIGSALSWHESYAEQKAKKPASEEFIKVTFVGNTSGQIPNQHQIYEVITA